MWKGKEMGDGRWEGRRGRGLVEHEEGRGEERKGGGGMDVVVVVVLEMSGYRVEVPERSGIPYVQLMSVRHTMKM